MKRRHFIKSSTALSSVPFLPFGLEGLGTTTQADPLEVHVFSKHLQFLDYDALGEAVKMMGFDGADLTVRPGGHVLPEQVEKDLPRAIKGLKKAGLEPKMMTTAITSASDKINQQVLKTAAEYGIKYYRPGWFRYPKDQPIIQSLDDLNQETIKIAELNKQLGINGSYQNHSGAHFVGASLWEVEKLLNNTNLPEMGCQFDIRHAVVEGGLSWPTSLRLINPRINTIVLKDCRWEKNGDKWSVLNTPIGEGMVDFDAYFKLLKQYQIKVPVSLHLEYDLGGAQHGQRENVDSERVFSAMKKDLKAVQDLWAKA